MTASAVPANNNNKVQNIQIQPVFQKQANSTLKVAKKASDQVIIPVQNNNFMENPAEVYKNKKNLILDE